MKGSATTRVLDTGEQNAIEPAHHTNRRPPLVAHIVFRLEVGGLQNGLVNLINRMPTNAYRHAVICLDDYDASFVKRICRTDVSVYSLHKSPGKDPACYLRLWRVLRCLKPDVVHTRNFGAIDCLPVAAMAGVSARIHSEHGWYVHDLHGTSWKFRWLRRAMSMFIYRYVVVSEDLAAWLRRSVKIPDEKVVHIPNGVDTERFTPATASKFGDLFMIGTAGRFAEVKDPLNLVEAFILLLTERPELQGNVRLVMLGDGELRLEALSRLRRSGFDRYASLPGTADDVANQLQNIDVFVVPSRSEGISNTILEAMATGLPVVATRVGGNPELVRDNDTGLLVQPRDPRALAQALTRYIDTPNMAHAHGSAGRSRVETLFSLGAMIASYTEAYDGALIKH